MNTKRRHCVVCGVLLGIKARPHKKTCSIKCRVARHRRNKKESEDAIT